MMIASRPAQAWKPTTKITLLFWNSFWRARKNGRLPHCPIDCELTSDKARLKEAAGVVFHIPTTQAVSSVPKFPGQRWVAWSMESDVNYPALADPTFMKQFELTMTYRLDSDVPCPYFGPDTLRDLQTPPRIKTEEAPAVYFARNLRDRSGRNGYVKELMQYIRVDSYGRCLRNKELEDDHGRQTKLSTIARYKFTLAFENSISKDYVTEKFFDPLIVGSVPVYLGAPNIDDFAPGERCFINVAHFSGPRALAVYLRSLSEDQRSYDEYLSWKRRSVKQRFIEMAELQKIDPICRICMKLRSG